jgi:hypothetical protein
LIGCGDDDDNATNATASELNNKQFEFDNGAAFGFANEPVTMSYGNFSGNTGAFVLSTTSVTASGTVVLGSCNHTVETTTNPSVLQEGQRINCAICDIENNGDMFVTCGEGAQQASSGSTSAGTSVEFTEPTPTDPTPTDPTPTDPTGTGGTGSGGGTGGNPTGL